MSEPASLIKHPVGAMAPAVSEFAFDEAHEAEAQKVLRRYPPERQASAVLPFLHLAQRQHGGWLPRPILDYIADRLKMPRIRVYEVATFYDMYNTSPVGRVQVRVCTTTPCWLCGSDDVVRACKDALGCDVNESTSDGRFFLREFECLGACCNAPMMWVDDDYYEDLDYAKTKAIVEALKRGERPPAGSQTGRKASMAAGGKTTLTTGERWLPGQSEGPRQGEGDAPAQEGA